MITCHLKGSLSDQLFQVFTTIAYAKSNSDTFFFILTNTLSFGEKTFWDSLFFQLALFNQLPLRLDFATIYLKEQNPVLYKPLPRLQLNLNKKKIIVKLIGEFQLHKYFHLHRQFIIDVLNIQQQYGKLFLLKQKVEYDIGIWNDDDSDNAYYETVIENKKSVLFLNPFLTFPYIDCYELEYKLILMAYSCKELILTDSLNAFWCGYLSCYQGNITYRKSSNRCDSFYPTHWKKL